MDRCQPWTEGAMDGPLETGPGPATIPEVRQQRLAVPERLDAAKGKEEEKRRHRKQKMKKLVQGRRSETEKEAAIK